MTDSARKNAEIKHNKNDLAEKKRHNRVSEQQKQHELGIQAVNAVGNVIGGTGKGLQGLSAFDNHPEWYKRQPFGDLTEYTAKSVSPLFNGEAPSGFVVSVEPDGSITQRSYTISNITVTPQLMVFYYVDAIGPQGSGSALARNAFNRQLIITKENILKVNSRSTSAYSGGDLGLIFQSATSIAAAVCNAARAVKAVLNEVPERHETADAIITACGFDPSAFRENIPMIKTWIRNIVIKLNQIPLPKTLSYIVRKIYLAGNLFGDSGTKREQYYLFVPQYHYYFATDDNDRPYCQAGDKLTPGGLTSQALIYAYLQRLYDHLCDMHEDSSLAQMFTDIRAAYSDNELFNFTAISNDLDVPLTINHDKYALSQIMNATMGFSFYDVGSPGNNLVPIPMDLQSLNFHQDANGYLYQDYRGSGYTSGTPSGICTDVIGISGTFVCDKMCYALNFYQDSVTPDDIIEATRLRWEYDILISGEDPVDARLHVTNSGTEVILDTYVINVVQGTVTSSWINPHINTNQGESWILTQFFNYAPIRPGGGTATNTFLAYQFDTIFNIKPEALRRLHESCVMSELAYQHVTKFVMR